MYFSIRNFLNWCTVLFLNFILKFLPSKKTPVSVNFHFTRKCNYQCGFCFHTMKTSFLLPILEAKRGLAMLKGAGMKKINFSGGEPFIHQKGRYLGELVKYCATDLEVDSISIVSNGSLIKYEWMERYAQYLDILAISCDSFDPSTNEAIGRFQNARTDHINQLYRIRDWCKQFDVIFKINSVVNTYNVHENMSQHMEMLNPTRWKVFQCLLIEGENVGSDALRNARKFYVTDEEFLGFVERHSHIRCLVPESNAIMRNSYLILDEYMRFLNCENNTKQPSKSILDVGVENAMKFAGFDEKSFFERGGFYTWSRPKIPEKVNDW